MNSDFSKKLCFVILPILAACSSPQSGSEEYWFNKMQMEQRAQCAQLPEPLASNCLRDNAAKSYQDFVREKQKKQTITQSSQ